jgi:hypothetical protein
MGSLGRYLITAEFMGNLALLVIVLTLAVLMAGRRIGV